VTLYRGRFAPTPTGPLHFGSLFAAVVSYLDAKAHSGQWLVRIEDIDPPREQPGATSGILKTLEAHGLEWDEEVTYQSQNAERYLENLNVLGNAEKIFWCKCSRKKLAGHSTYPGTCRQQSQPKTDCAIRLHAQTGLDQFSDLFQGLQSANLAKDYGDVVLKRRDGLFAYQLAVVSDDIAQNISHIIRGIDLLESVFWQRELYRNFNAPLPVYGHFAVIHNTGSEQKLSKQNMASPVKDESASASLARVFELLQIPVELGSPKAMLNEGVSRWQRKNLLSKRILLFSNNELD